MATKSTTKEAEGEKPAARKASTKRAATAKKAASTGPAASGEAKRRLPTATVRALKELEAGKLNRYADADELFQKPDIKLGKGNL